jgi:hypothetical protein
VKIGVLGLSGSVKLGDPRRYCMTSCPQLFLSDAILIGANSSESNVPKTPLVRYVFEAGLRSPALGSAAATVLCLGNARGRGIERREKAMRASNVDEAQGSHGPGRFTTAEVAHGGAPVRRDCRHTARNDL